MEKLVNILIEYKNYIYLLLTFCTLGGILFASQAQSSETVSEPSVSMSEFRRLVETNEKSHQRIEEKLDRVLFRVMEK